MSELTPLERAVLEMLVAGDHAILTSLRAQLEHVVVASREKTGAGFFTRLTVTAGTSTSLIDRSFRLGDVSGTADGVRHGFGFVLWIENGQLHELEGYTYDEPWPAEVRGLKLSYASDRKSDLETLRSLTH